MDEANPTKSSPWPMIGAIASLAGAGAIIAATVLIAGTRADLAAGRAEQKEAFAALAAMRARLDDAASTTWTDAKSVVKDCVADNEGTTCTVTNVRNTPITTCMQGSLTKKKASGVGLTSLPLCTGRLGPRETKRLTAPWSGGFARDVCAGEGLKLIDWDVCDFTAIPFDLPTMEAKAKAEAAAAPPASTGASSAAP